MLFLRTFRRGFSFFPTTSDAAALINDDTIVDSNASEEIDGSFRAKKELGLLTAQQVIPSPLRRHHLKFGVLGKRHSYGYLGKRANGKKNIVFFRTHHVYRRRFQKHKWRTITKNGWTICENDVPAVHSTECWVRASSSVWSLYTLIDWTHHSFDFFFLHLNLSFGRSPARSILVFISFFFLSIE